MTNKPPRGHELAKPTTACSSSRDVETKNASMSSCMWNASRVARQLPPCQMTCVEQECTLVPLDCERQRCFLHAAVGDSLSCENSTKPCAVDCVRTFLDRQQHGDERTLFVVGDSLSGHIADELRWQVARLHGRPSAHVLWPYTLKVSHNPTIHLMDLEPELMVASIRISRWRTSNVDYCFQWLPLRFRLCMVRAGYSLRGGGSYTSGLRVLRNASGRVDAQACPRIRPNRPPSNFGSQLTTIVTITPHHHRHVTKCQSGRSTTWETRSSACTLWVRLTPLPSSW